MVGSTAFTDAFSPDWANSLSFSPQALQSLNSIQSQPIMLASQSAPSLVGTAPDSMGIPDMTGMGGGGGFLKGFGIDEAKLAIGGLQTIGQLWGAWQNAKLAKKNFRMQKDWGETNMANQIRSYNTQLDGVARSRGVVEGQSAAQVQQYIEDNKARRHNGG